MEARYGATGSSLQAVSIGVGLLGKLHKGLTGGLNQQLALETADGVGISSDLRRRLGISDELMGKRGLLCSPEPGDTELQRRSTATSSAGQSPMAQAWLLDVLRLVHRCSLG